MKIKNENYADLDEEVFKSIELFREVVRERSRSSSISDRIKRKIGLNPNVTDIWEVKSELFDELDLSADIEEKIHESTTAVENGEPDVARERLKEQFGSVCDREHPDSHIVSNTGRFSHCHRHRDEYVSPDQLN